MAYALHNTIIESCDASDSSKCSIPQPAPSGAELLRAIRNLSFTDMQGTQVFA